MAACFRAIVVIRMALVMCVTLVACASWAETYLSEEQAVKIALPTATTVSTEFKQLTPAQREALQHTSGLRFPEAQYKVFIGHGRNGEGSGYAVIMNEIGKEEPITFIVGVTPEGKAGEVALLEYRESRGSEVHEKRFTHQFKGKKSTDPIQVNQDIINYTGATLSSHAMARGVKKALLIVQEFYLHK
jgi:FAD:protein FMN transferase